MEMFTQTTLKNVLEALFKGQDYRNEVTGIITDQFLRHCIDFFKLIVEAKIDDEQITLDWYKKHFVNNTKLNKADIAINSGINMKTIKNQKGSEAKNVVIDASKENYEDLKNIISELISTEPDLDIKLTIKYNNVSVDLTLNETLVVINSLAVKRAAIRGGAWSEIGKNIEKPLMLALCKLYSIPRKHIDDSYTKADYTKDKTVYSREIDFYLKDENLNELLCEVKLMGKGNPESADAVIARGTNIFVADTLSETNRRQLDDLNVHWIELRSEIGFKKFKSILEKCKIPYDPDKEPDIDDALKAINDISIYK